MEITGFVSLKNPLCSQRCAQQWCWWFCPESGSHTITNNDTESKGAFTETRCWSSSQCFLRKGGLERHPKHILKIYYKSSFQYRRRARTFIRKMLVPHIYLHNIRVSSAGSPVLPNHPSPGRKGKLPCWDGNEVFQTHCHQLPNSGMSLSHTESPNGFNKWQPSSQNP